MTGRTMHLNINVLSLGSHPAAWRVSSAGPRGYLTKEYYQELARIAEHGLLDAFFLADALTVSANPGGAPSWSLDPTVLAVSMAEVTSKLGFILSASTTFDTPYALARRFATLDHLTQGRVGWNIVTTYDEPAALNFGLDKLPPRPDRYGRAEEFAEVVLKLWDSWEDDAIVADTATGTFADVARIHPVDHDGQRFTVRGPLQVPRSPQGRLLLVQAGGSEGGRALAGRYADAVFASQLSIKGAREYYADIKSRAVALGRDPELIAILPGLSLTIGRTDEEAWDRRNRLDEIAGGTERGLERLASRLGIAPGQLELDKPIPAELLGNARNSTGAWGFADATVALIKDEQPTVRELLRQGGGGHRLVVGSPEKIADTMQEWFLTRACDGFNLMFDVYPDGLQLFVDLVVPELQRRGLFREEYAADTLLRSRYGLSRPASVYEQAGTARPAPEPHPPELPPAPGQTAQQPVAT